MSLALPLDAAQHRPRPLPLFLSMLRSETDGDQSRLSAALEGLRRYQAAQRPTPMAAMPVAAAVGRATLHDYGGDGPLVLFVPSLINPPDILDLDSQRSLLRWLATQGLRPLLLNWGTPRDDERNCNIAGHVEQFLLPLIDALGEPVALAGYCLGGTIALATASLSSRITALALIAAPWRFAGYPDETRAALAALWAQAEPAAQAIGLMPMEVLQAAFWRLDPARSVAKFEAFGRQPADDAALAAFVRLEDWANDGPPLTFAAAHELFNGLYQQDLTDRGEWRVAGQAMDPARLNIPILDIASTSDRIVPAAARLGAGERIDSGLGHVGMIVSGRARAAIWQPLARWLSQAGRS